MAKQLLRFFISLLFFSLILASVHYLFEFILPNAASLYLDPWQIYLFLGLITFFGYLFLLFVHDRDNTKTGFAFIGVGFIKMLASVLFLYPLIASKPESIMIDILSFFVPYFLFLAFELYFVTRLLAKKQ